MRVLIIGAVAGLVASGLPQAPGASVTGTFKSVKKGAIQPTSAAAFPARRQRAVHRLDAGAERT